MITIPIKIKIEMLKRGIVGAEIARRVGVNRVAIYRTIKGQIKSYKLRKAICKATNLPMSIWDELDKAE